MHLEYKWQATLIVALGLFMAVLDNTVVNVALPQIKSFYHIANYSDVIWVSTAYFLAQAAVIPAVGYISDIVGTKNVFIAALALFTLGSALCIFAPSLPALIIFRVFQGIGGGALFPIVFAIVFRIFPPAERGQASAVVSIPVLLAPAFGPTIGGYLTTVFDWHAIFAINVPIGIGVLALAYYRLNGLAAERAAMGNARGLPVPTRRNFDFGGLLLVMSGVTTLVYGISEAGSLGWSDRKVVTYMIVGAALLATFTYVELKVAKDPVIDLRLFTTYSFTLGILVTGIVGAFFFGGVLLFPIFFQNALGYSPLNSGEIFILQGLMAGVGVAVSGRLYNLIGPRPLAATGLALVAFSTIGLLHMDAHTTGWSIQGWMLIRGFGFGMINTPAQTLTLSTVNNRDMARASSLVNVMRQIFSAVGIATITTYLAQQTASHAQAIGTTIQQQFAHRPPQGVAAQCIASVGKQGQAAIQACAGHYVGQNALIAGINDAFGFVLIGFCVGIGLALVMGRDKNAQGMKSGQAAPSSEVRPAMAAE